MLYWVIYDVGDDKKRGKISRQCKDAGLIRVQRSAFLGNLTKNSAEMLEIKINEILGEDAAKDVVFLIPTCKECFQSKIIVGFLDEERVREKDFLLVK